MFVVQNRDRDAGAARASSSASGFCISNRQADRSLQSALAWLCPFDEDHTNQLLELEFHFICN
jgi:hypothetical protein